MNPRCHVLGGIVLAALAGPLAACSTTAGPGQDSLRLWGAASLSGEHGLGVMMIRDVTSVRQGRTFARSVLDPGTQPPLEGLDRFGQYPFAFGQRDQIPEAGISLGSPGPSRKLRVFWEMAEDGQGNGVFLYLCILLGDADWFLFAESTSEGTEEAQTDKVADSDQESSVTVADIVFRAEILEAVEQTGSKVILSDRRDEKVKTTPLDVDLPVLWADLLKEGDREVICAAFAEGVAETLVRNLDTLPRCEDAEEAPRSTPGE